ncbi:MAG: HAD family hydrolase [Muribaculaceae bacterium]|nr:HAD family hydrolase [Muribaculaceae bacterium]
MSAATAVLFDLDDTLYAEKDYQLSGWRAVARHAEQFGVPYGEAMSLMLGADNAFDALHARVPAMEVRLMLDIYRTHMPELHVSGHVKCVLAALRERGCGVGIITDGRSISQRNKISSLELEAYVDYISVSEEIGADKLKVLPFELAAAHFSGCREFWYVGDNPAKDFLWPNRLGWHTVMLKERHPGANVHPQTGALKTPEHAPQYRVAELPELLRLIR